MINEEEKYQSIMDIEEWIGHDNISMNYEEKIELTASISYLISYFEDNEEYLKCRDLQEISEIISNITCVG